MNPKRHLKIPAKFSVYKRVVILGKKKELRMKINIDVEPKS